HMLPPPRRFVGVRVVASGGCSSFCARKPRSVCPCIGMGGVSAAEEGPGGRRRLDLLQPGPCRPLALVGGELRLGQRQSVISHSALYPWRLSRSNFRSWAINAP